MKYLNILNKIIEYSFYAIFFFVPLVLAPDTSELFEFNKMWLTYILAIVILGAWVSKMLIKKQFRIQRTPLDIPLALFLLSQVVSTVISLDTHISIWGYYSRFNGGLLSIITYIFLYYAFISNFRENAKEIVKRSIYVILASGVVVALWGLPSHFGYDPTCLVFRGHLDVACWTSDFFPKLRIFSTLGQPDWLAAYLLVLLPISLVFFIRRKNIMSSTKNMGFALLYFLMFVLFFLDLGYTNAKSGFVATWISAAFFVIAYLFLELRNRTEKFKVKELSFDLKLLAVSALSAIIITFILGAPIQKLAIFSYSGVKNYVSQMTAKPAENNKQGAKKAVPTPPPPPGASGELGGTDSGTIRLYVWRGAIDAWVHNPVIGTGVETFAFAYYRYRPEGHNLTSEWRYLYNKAHNEFLNYLATTGAFGFLTYASIILLFMYYTVRYLLQDKTQDSTNKRALVLALLTGYISILITDFFGFSVVIINVFMFLIPAFVFILVNIVDFDKGFSFSWARKIVNNKNHQQPVYVMTKPIGISIAVVTIICAGLIFTLISFWNADKQYALGYNLDRAGQYQNAYQPLHAAVAQRQDEPVFKDEMSINDAVLAISFVQQKSTDQNQQKQQLQLAQKLAQEAISTSDYLTTNYPNNVVFWKTRVRIMYTLAQADGRYLPLALEAIKKAAKLAPTDADISYNMGVLYGQNGDSKNAVATLENTVKLKPDLSNAYYALGIFYHQLAINDKGQVVNQDYEKKAIATMEYMLKYWPTDTRPADALKTWGGTK